MSKEYRVYKISDNLNDDLNVRNIGISAHIIIGEGLPTIDLTDGTWIDFLNAVSEVAAPIMGVTVAQALEMFTQMTAEDQDIYFNTNANLVQSSLWLNEIGSGFELIKVLEAGSYEVVGTYTPRYLSLETGWYICVEYDSESGSYFSPVGKAETVKIDEKFMPDEYFEIKKALPYVDIEFGSVPDYSSSKTYNVGDVCTYYGYQYKCTSSTSGNFDSNCWEKQEDSQYLYIYYKGTQNEVRYLDFINLYESGKQFRYWWAEIGGPYYFDLNFVSYSQYFPNIHFRLTINEEFVWDLYIPPNRDYDDEKEATHNLPYLVTNVFGGEYVEFVSGWQKERLVEYLSSGKTVLYRPTSSASDSRRYVITSWSISTQTYNAMAYPNTPKFTYTTPDGNRCIVTYFASNIIQTTTHPCASYADHAKILKSTGSGDSTFGDLVSYSGNAPTDVATIWVDTWNNEVKVSRYGDTWDVIGRIGAQQIIAGTTAPTDTSVLWLDTNEGPGDVIYNGNIVPF